MGSEAPGHPAIAVPATLSAWLQTTLGDPGPFELTPLGGGNSNETLELRSPAARRILRRPPAAAIAPSAHNVAREDRILRALEGSGVPAPRPGAVCEDASVFEVPFLVMEAVDGVAVTEALPSAYPPSPQALPQVGERVVEALADLHAVPWRQVGLADFGRPEGFLERQVERWQRQLDGYRFRELPYHAELAGWLAAERPQAGEPAIMHGDFHLDNCLISAAEPIGVTAIIDWEMATIGDPLLDLGLLLAFWGPDRPERPAMPRVQAASRLPGAPSREALAAHYAERSGRSIERLDWYMALAFWKLATIVEGAYAQYTEGKLRSRYARELGDDVPALLAEAAGFAGLRR
ncbi:MAG: phosphotransferase family protein [Solirubrobacterales bacterium]